MLTKEECLEALNDIENELCELEEYRTGVDVCCLYDESLDKLNQLINEHFENSQIEWLRNCIGNEPFDLIFSSQEEVKRWVDRMTWHVKECDKLGRELDQLKSNPPLKFEEINTGKPVFDNTDHGWIVVAYIDLLRKRIRYIDVDGLCGWIEFEENRFYRKQVEE